MIGNAKMMSIFSVKSNIYKSLEPFPHVVIDNVLDENTLDKIELFLDSFIQNPYKGLQQDSGRPNTQVFIRPSDLIDVNLPYTDFVHNFMLSQATMLNLVSLMNMFPSVVNKSLRSLLSSGTYNADKLADYKCRLSPVSGKAIPVKNTKNDYKKLQTINIGFDCQFQLVLPPTYDSIKTLPIHHDSSNKIFNCLLYLKHPEDTSAGGNLRLWRPNCSNDLHFSSHRYFDQESTVTQDQCSLAKEIKYSRNRLVIMENSRLALHDISERYLTKSMLGEAYSKIQTRSFPQFVRRMLNINVTLPGSIF